MGSALVHSSSFIYFVARCEESVGNGTPSGIREKTHENLEKTSSVHYTVITRIVIIHMLFWSNGQGFPFLVLVTELANIQKTRRKISLFSVWRRKNLSFVRSFVLFYGRVLPANYRTKVLLKENIENENKKGKTFLFMVSWDISIHKILDHETRNQKKYSLKISWNQDSFSIQPKLSSILRIPKPASRVFFFSSL